ncbi:MAG: hypothetical protein ACOYXN_09245 [Acidobacteriota bacterium]
MEYRHTQVGRLLLALMVAMACLVPALLLLDKYRGDPMARIAFSVAPAGMLIAGAVFSFLTVTVDREALVLRFGLGAWRRRVPLADVVQAEVRRVPWFWGYGIRLAPKGWLYRVAGLDAVDLTLRSGRHVYVGTDEPEALLSALRSFGVAVI